MSSTITFVAEQTQNLDTVCYRGSAPLSQLAQISQADVFDQVTNPDGLQRDLSRKHAIEAYDYVARAVDENYPRAFPEVVLNVRDKSVVKIQTLKLPGTDNEDIVLVRLTFDLDKIEKARSVKVSRVDGNHRLWFAEGDGERKPLTLSAPYQLHVGLTREQEASLFLDINAEQKGLNTSHLSVLRSRLTPEEIELLEHPARAYAKRLADDTASPFHELVYFGGSKAGIKAEGHKRPISFTSLEGGTRRMLRKSQYLAEMVSDPQAQYEMVRRYWRAVQATWPEAWEPTTMGDWVITQNIGVTSLSLLGATVLDRALASGEVDDNHIEALVGATKDVFDWHKNTTASNGGVSGMSGNRAALDIAGRMAAKLPKRKS